VNRADGALDASFSTSATDPATVNIPWGTIASHDAERDAYAGMKLAAQGVDIAAYMDAKDPWIRAALARAEAWAAARAPH